MNKSVSAIAICFIGFMLSACSSDPPEPTPLDKISSFSTYPTMNCGQLANEEINLLGAIEYSENQAKNSNSNSGVFSMISAVNSAMGTSNSYLNSAVASGAAQMSGANAQSQSMGANSYGQRLSVVKSYQRSKSCPA